MSRKINTYNSFSSVPAFSNTKSILFDGINEYVDITGILSALAATTVGTWSFWLKPALYTGVDYPVSFGDTNGANFFLCFTDDVSGQPSKANIGFAISIGGVGWQFTTTGGQIDIGMWNKIGLVHGGVSPILLINGVMTPFIYQVQSNKTYWFNNGSAVLDNGSVGLLRFNNNSAFGPYSGQVDELLFINRALTQPQDANIWNGGSPKDESGIANGVGYIRFGDAAGDIWDGSKWIFRDSIGGNDANSVNMEIGDVVSDAP